MVFNTWKIAKYYDFLWTMGIRKTDYAIVKETAIKMKFSSFAAIHRTAPDKWTTKENCLFYDIPTSRCSFTCTQYVKRTHIYFNCFDYFKYLKYLKRAADRKEAEESLEIIEQMRNDVKEAKAKADTQTKEAYENYVNKVETMNQYYKER